MLPSPSDAEVMLTLEVEVEPSQRETFIAFCREAFSAYESVGGTKMVLYEDPRAPGRFNEVAYYKTSDDCARSEAALENDPVQKALIARWRKLLKGPPKVTRWTRNKLAGD